MLRVMKDAVGNILKDGETLHTNVRFQVDQTGRVAVFTDYTKPPVVYATGEVTYQVVRVPCSCKGDKGRQWVSRLWQQADKVTA